MSVSRVIEKITHGWTGRGWRRRRTRQPRQPFTLQTANVLARLPESKRPAVRKALRPAWDRGLGSGPGIRTIRRRPSVCCATSPGGWSRMHPARRTASWRGSDEILTVVRLGRPSELRRSLACTNIIENALGTVRRVTANVKRWRNAERAMRWTATGLFEANRSFRRLKACRQLPLLRLRLEQHGQAGQPPRQSR